MDFSSSRFVEQYPERPQPALKEPTDGRNAPIHPLGDIRRRQPLQVAQLDSLPLVVRKLG